MNRLLTQTKRDLRSGEQSWRVLMLGSFFSSITTVVYLVILN